MNEILIRNKSLLKYHKWTFICVEYFNNLPYQQLNKNKDDITCITCNCTDHTTKWILKNSFGIYEPLIFTQNSTNFSIDSQKYLSEMKSLLEYFYKIKHSNSNSNLVSTIISYYQFEIVFYYYQDFLFDVSISFKLEWFQKDNIKRKEKLINLEAPLNSSILSKTLEEGSQIKKLIFSNSKSFYPLYNPAIHISFSGNTLTIDWYEMNPNYLKLLLELWPGLILRLEYIKKYNDCWDLDLIQAFLSYCGRSPPCWRLSFSKVIIEINIYYIRHSIFIESYENVSKLKHLIDSLSKIYDVELKNISYEDLFINRTDYFKQYIGRKRDEYNNEKLKFEWIKWYLDGFYRNTNDGFNQTIEELKLKEFEFYADKIHMNRYV